MFWPWACRSAPGGTEAAVAGRHPVDFEQPPSFHETLKLSACGTRVATGRWRVVTPTAGISRRPADPVAIPEPPEHHLRWFNDQGRRLGSDGTSDLAYGEDLLFRSGDDTYVMQRVEGRDRSLGALRVTAAPCVGSAGEAQFPVWSGRLQIPDPRTHGGTDCLVRLIGGPLGRFAIRFDLQTAMRTRLVDDPDLERRRRRRPAVADGKALVPTIDMHLVGALDTTGTRSRLNADIRFSHPIRGVAWIVLRPGMTDADFHRSEEEAEKALRGSWSTDATRTVSDIPSAWQGHVWPELAAALQIGLRETLPGWQQYGRVMAFHPAENAARELGVRALVFFVEPIPTEATVSDAVNALATDPDLLYALLERCVLDLDTVADPRQLSLRARTCWERIAESSGVSAAAQLLVSMLGLVRPEERPDLVPWLDQSLDGEALPHDLHLGDLGLTPDELAAIVEAMRVAGRQDLADWVQTGHGLPRPSPSMRNVTFDAWEDRTANDGRRFRIRAEVDISMAEAIETHFGVPQTLLDEPFVPEDALLAAAWKNAWQRALLLHGLHHSLMMNAAWHVQASTRPLQSVAEAIATTVTGMPLEASSDRAVVEALTSYVQNAVPYRRIHDRADGKYRYGYRTPLMTLLQGGDCDSKSMLLICLIRSIRPHLPLALIHIEAGEPHAMLAVGGIAGVGEVRKTLGGIEHVLIESTSDWDIGQISEDSDDKSITAFRIPNVTTIA
jgi:hypothetical protein